MSTLNSSQLHVKRSSTRLHAPPGGYSSLSFGSGGFGTTEPQEKNSYGDPADPPSSSAMYRGGGTNLGTSNYLMNNQVNDGGMRHPTPQGFHATARSTQHGQSGYLGGGHTYGVGGVASQGSSLNSFSGRSGPYPNNDGRPASTQSNFSWGECGSQPPLTSSKRDQNWEKKRRLWLARKHGGSQCQSSSLPPPPMTALKQGERGFGGHFEHLASYNPPSPLTKFMAQQSHCNPFTPEEVGGGFVAPPTGNVGRPSSSRTGTAMSGEYRNDPPSTYSARLMTSSAGFPHSSPGGGVYSQPSTASSTVTSTSRRQPPGGNSNWSPYS